MSDAVKHDDRCEDAGSDLRDCRCEVRALEDHLRQRTNEWQEARTERLNAMERYEAAESRLAALRPLVRAAVEFEDSREWDGPLSEAIDRAVRALDPALIAWAKGGE